MTHSGKLVSSYPICHFARCMEIQAENLCLFISAVNTLIFISVSAFRIITLQQGTLTATSSILVYRLHKCPG